MTGSGRELFSGGCFSGPGGHEKKLHRILNFRQCPV